MSKKIKNCIVIGCGTWGAKHVEFLSSQKRLKGIYDIDKKKVYIFQKNINVLHITVIKKF